MSKTGSQNSNSSARTPAFIRYGRLLGLVILLAPGCAALHPVRGVPASYLPGEYIGPSRNDKRTIDLSLLVRSQPDQHRVAAGDVLSIYVPRVLGAESTEINMAGLAPPINMPHSLEEAPTVGFPIQVRDDNTISLPQIPPVNVYGLTLEEVEDKIRRAYTEEHKILPPGEAMVMVSLQRPRIHRVLVVRQETSNDLSVGSGPGSVNIGAARKGTARTVTLKAYENDVLHALSLVEGADGLPGLNAENTIYIIRRRQQAGTQDPYLPVQQTPGFHPDYPASPMTGPGMAPISSVGHQGSLIQTASYETTASPVGSYRSGVTPAGHSLASVPPAPQPAPIQPLPSHSFGQSMPYSQGGFPPAADVGTPAPIASGGYEGNWANALHNIDSTIDNPNIIRIPIRLGPGERPCITEDQITLYDGDIVFIESRETEVFYTAGLLGGGQYTLPRDYDLGVLEAISIAEGRNQGGASLSRSIGGVSAMNQDVANSASRVAILRTLPNGQRINIEVDLKKAMRYQHENIIVQPGDMLILEYTMPEAIAAFTQRFLMEGALIGIATSMFMSGGNGGN